MTDPRRNPARPRPRFRLAVIDVDGTLLDSAGVLRPRVIAAVRAVDRSGCRVTIATGRRWRTARPIAEALGIRAPLILHGGALIVDPADGRILHDSHLPRAVAVAVVAALTRAGWQPIIFGNGREAERLYSGPPNQDDDHARRYLGAFPEIVTRLPGPDLAGVPDPLGIGVLGDPERLAAAEAIVQAIPGCRSFVTAFQRFGCHLLEVVDPACSKGAAIEWLGRELGIDRSRVIAIGDHRNDLEMIAAAGFGVAMGDSPPELRAAADAITGTADEDGVVAALYQHVFGYEHDEPAEPASEE